MRVRVRMRGLAAAACAALTAAVLWAQGLVICRACGREAKPGATVCAHCAAALPAPRAEAPPAPAPAPQPDAGAAVAAAATAAAQASLRQARELEKAEPGVALGYFHNALALSRLVPPGALPAGAGEAVLSGIERAMQALLRGQVTCRKCGGSGKFQLDLSKVDRRKGSVKAVEGVACALCRGQGGFPGYRDIAKVKMAVLQGRQEFERRQMVAGELRLGRALVPASLDALLNNRQRALVMTGVPSPCGACQLTGREVCTRCRGQGWVPCEYDGCDNGVFEAPRATTGRTEKRIGEEETRKCPKCEGLGQVLCEACRGCTSVACKRCDGSGQAPRCARCTGSGIAACPKCKGAGQMKGGTCPECKGETVVLCSACRGEGAVAR